MREPGYYSIDHDADASGQLGDAQLYKATHTPVDKIFPGNISSTDLEPALEYLEPVVCAKMRIGNFRLPGRFPNFKTSSICCGFEVGERRAYRPRSPI